MRQVTINLYQFAELSEEAKAFAIKTLREDAATSMAECDWMDANESFECAQMKAGVRCQIDDSSQGHSLRRAFLTDKYFSSQKEEIKEFKQFQKKMANWKAGTWSDQLITRICVNAEYDMSKCYEVNVGQLFVRFFDEVYWQTCDYWGDKCVIDYINGQSYEFTEDGRVFNHKLPEE